MCCCFVFLQERCTLAVISNFRIFLESDLRTEFVQPPASSSVHVVRAEDNKQVMTSQVRRQRGDGGGARCSAVQTKAEFFFLQ